MSDWTAGYVAEIDYTYGYYPELNPLRIKLAFLNQGLEFPEVGTACELGYGQGLGTNMLAASSKVAWWGTDFNPSHAGFAQELGGISGAQLFDESFAEFCGRSDLPEFDFIALHGIWTWISNENRAIIVEFIRRKLKVGGVVYMSYNTLPGWSTAAPLRHLMSEYKTKMTAPGQGIVSSLENALEFTQKLFDSEPLWTKANPSVIERFNKAIKPQNKHYLAHEYLNGHWDPLYFASMVNWLEPTKMQFACSANLLDAVDVINLTAQQQALLAEIPDPMFRQSIRDYMVNQQFRKDYWVKGARKMTLLQQAEAFRSLRVLLVTRREDVPLKINAALGEGSLQETVYEPILDLLSDLKPRSLGEMEAALNGKNIQFSQLMQAIMILSGMGHVYSVQEESLQNSKNAKALNAALMDQARGNTQLNYLVSPVTGGGHVLNRIQQLFLLAIRNGKKSPDEWVKFVWEILAMQSQKLVKAGNTLSTPEENLAELAEQARTFAEKQLPVLKALQIA
ncbi:methyltransferase regulatory domain-containing protein [Limnohabitans sp.]|uniref:methyltransferase regulatory domain-containing protein n=1 Tax=Limnohabitans sp. TaxID=1907725 RepID=UPI002AFF82F0|nr:methyltransferase regulatory domain-containing protein [Limnohabitans sp.]